MSEKVSVCMATYNGEKYLKQQIDSILNQLGEDDELVISDDGSTDNTISIIKEYNDSRIKLLNHEHLDCDSKFYKTNVFVAANFENALKHSEGDYVFLSDQDDIWMDDKVVKMVQVLKEKGGVAMSAINVVRADDTLKKKDIVPHEYSFFKGLLVAKYLGSSMGMTRAFLQKALPFPNNIVSHDAWLGLLATYNKELTIIDEPLLLYRRHSENVTSKAIKTSLFAKLSYRCGLCINVLKRSHNKNK